MSRCQCRYPCGCYTFVKPYGFFDFLVDAFMTLITCGLWLIRIFCREMRR